MSALQPPEPFYYMKDWCRYMDSRIYVVRDEWSAVLVERTGQGKRMPGPWFWHLPAVSHKGKQICHMLIYITRHYAMENGRLAGVYEWLVWQGGTLKRIVINVNNKSLEIMEERV